MIGTRIVQVLLLGSTLLLVAYALRTAWLDYWHAPCEVLHKYDGKPTGSATYFAEFDTRKEAHAYAKGLRWDERCSHVQVKPLHNA